MDYPERLAPWEISLKDRHPIFRVGDRVVRRDDEATTGTVVIPSGDERCPWPGAIGITRIARHGKEVLEWWRTQSTDLA